MSSTGTAPLIDPRTLPHEFPRQFVPADIDWNDWGPIARLFERLEAEPLDTAPQVEAWLERRAELGGCLSQEGALRNLRLSVNTDDAAAKAAVDHWRERLSPKFSEASHRLNQKVCASPGWAALDPETYRVVKRSLDNHRTLFCQANIPLGVEAGRWGQEYQQCVGAYTIPFRGTPYTPQQLAKLMEDPDRAVREEAWRASGQRFLQDRDLFDGWLDRLTANRHQQALNAGFPDYRAFAFRIRERFDYTPEECLGYHRAVERFVGPVAKRMAAKRAHDLGIPGVRPWDTAVDPAGSGPLAPFTTAQELESRAANAFRKMDPELSGFFELMRRYRLMDVENRPHKRAGAFLTTFDEVRLPFLFMNAVGRASDVDTMFHESGHAFHYFLYRQKSPVLSRGYPMEIAEVASMAMELFAVPYWDEFYPAPEDRRRAESFQWKTPVGLLSASAMVDALQHWLYTHPGHSREERAACWINLYKRFYPEQDVTGIEDLLLARMYGILHIFLYPFYYIEYGIAQLGALQLWRNSQRDYSGTLRAYKRGLSLGYAQPLPQLYEAMGIQFSFGEDMLQTCMADVTAQLERLGMV